MDVCVCEVESVKGMAHGDTPVEEAPWVEGLLELPNHAFLPPYHTTRDNTKSKREPPRRW